MTTLRRNYADEYSYNDKYSTKMDPFNDDMYARDGGYGHQTQHHGGYMKMSYKKIDLLSLLGLASFALAIGYLIYYCLLNNANMCTGIGGRRRRRSVRDNEREDLGRASENVQFILGLIERAENIWSNIT